jgi:uncharacterized protein (UPF0210 family)
MIRRTAVAETLRMFQEENLDVRTVTLGLNIEECSSPILGHLLDKLSETILRRAGGLVRATKELEQRFGVPVVNKRIAVTPIASVAAGHTRDALVKVAAQLDRVASETGVDLLGGFGAFMQKSMTPTAAALLDSLPEALSTTQRVCGGLNVASTRVGINLDAVRNTGHTIKAMAEADKQHDGFACAKLVVFANMPDDNPFMAGATHGSGEADAVINIGVSGPGVIKRALQRLIEQVGPDQLTLVDIAEEIKITSFRVTRVGELLGRELAQSLGVQFGIVDLSLAPTPKVGDSIGEILQAMGIMKIGAPGSTAALAMLNDAVKKGGAFASSSVGGLSGAFIPVMEDATLAAAAAEGSLCIEKLEAMTSVCSVGLDMVPIPGDTPADTIAAIIADEMAIGVMNNKTTATRLIPVPGKKAGEQVNFGGLFGASSIMTVRDTGGADQFIKFGGRIPAPVQSLRN